MVISKKSYLDQTTVLKIEADEYFVNLSVIETTHDTPDTNGFKQIIANIYLDQDDLTNICKVLAAYRDVLK